MLLFYYSIKINIHIIIIYILILYIAYYEYIEKKRKILEEKKELEMKNALKVSMTFTEEDKVNAIKKLRNSAKLYDKTTPGAMSMKSFEVKEMPPHIFKEQLKRIFNLQVSPAEMGALMAVFDGIDRLYVYLEYVCVYICMYGICMCVYMYIWNMYVSIYGICMCVYMYIWNMYVCIYVPIYMYMSNIIQDE